MPIQFHAASRRFNAISRTNLFIVALCILIVLITATGEIGLNTLGLFAPAVDNGEFWRVLTANLVHFGWIHSGMNISALVLCGYVFFNQYPLRNFLSLLTISFLSVGLGIYLFNPQYMPYAGLSGAIHGLIAAGLLITKEYPAWLRLGAGILLLGKLVHENIRYFESADLQHLIGAPVAAEAHVYGAIGGLLYILFTKIRAPIKKYF